MTLPSVLMTDTHYAPAAWRVSCSVVLIGLLTLATAVYAENSSENPSLVEQGRRIYQEGRLSSGEPLRGQQLNAGEMSGEAAACIKCHRRSGMGSLEGTLEVPPVTGRFIFAGEDRPLVLPDHRTPSSVNRAHDPYTDAQFANALRGGIKFGGKPMLPLMPRYTLSDADLHALKAYLQQLSAQLSPGVGDDSLHFATIITPGVEAQRREVLVKMLQAAFNQRNASQASLSGRMRMPVDVIPRVQRNWVLSVWELKGAPESWGAQLAEYYHQQPVFAVVSGLSNSTWAPVQQFCEQQQVPCLFPSVTLPPADPGYYSLYYSQGLALEAKVLAKRLQDRHGKAPRRMVQLFRDGAGEKAAQQLSTALPSSGIAVERRAVSKLDKAAVTAALKGVTEKDQLLLWLSPTDLDAFVKAAPKKLPSLTYVSGLLAADHFSSLPKTWHAQLRVLYPFELGEKRQSNRVASTGWLNNWHMPLVDEPMQSEVFFTLLFLTDLTSQMLDNLYRDYLIERAEDMLSWGTNVTAYPRLSLATGQRFASKGAYIARFDAKGRLVADSEWIIP